MGSPETLALWRRQLAEGLAAMQIDLSIQQQQLALDYLALLMKWNKAYNLTAIRDPGQAVALQLLDSYSILPLLYGSRILDVGTGPGLPGIPLAIARPDSQFALLDSNGKKTRFVQQAVHALGLANVRVLRDRVESYQSGEPFDTVVSRAFAELNRMEQLSRHLIAADGRLLAMKGVKPESAELHEMERLGYRISLQALSVPGIDAQRHAVILQRV